MCYNEKNVKSNNKCKTTWDIIKEFPRKQHSKTDIQELLMDSKHLQDQQHCNRCLK
jgi:hypothetical protein